MSRHPQKLHKSRMDCCVQVQVMDDVDTEIYVKFIATHAVPNAMTREEVKAATGKDCLLQHIIHTDQWYTLNNTFISGCD